MSEILRETLVKQEGLRLKPYRCTAGKLTIGYGRNLDDNGISQDEAEIMLSNDIRAVKVAVYSALPWVYSMDENRQMVILNMAYNLGIAGLLEFRRFLHSAEFREYQTAAKRMLESLWATQVGNRATYLAKVMESGEL